MKALLKYSCLSIFLCGFCVNNISAQGIIITIAGNGISQYIGDGYPATSYSLALPKGIYVNKNGKVYIADYANDRIRTVYNDTLRTIADTMNHGGETGDGGLADTATLTDPDGVCLDSAGNIYITEWYNGLIRKIDGNTGIISSICGTIGGGFGGDGGPATSAMLSQPGGACTDMAGNIYIPDYGNQRIRKITMATGDINTIAGTGVNSYSGNNGPATSATLSYPNSICTDMAGNIYFSEHGNNVIRRIDAVTGIITTVAGNGTQGYSGNGSLAVNAQLALPNGVFVDKNNYIYISDYGNNVIRLVTPAGIIYTIAGNGGYGYTGDGGPPQNATFRGPTAVCTDDSGYVYVSDGLNAVIRKISPVDTLNLGVRTIAQASFNIYPNPCDGKFTVISGTQAGGYIQVMNMMGQCVYNQPFDDKATINLSGCPAGMYFVQYTSDNGVLTKKIIIR